MPERRALSLSLSLSLTHATDFKRSVLNLYLLAVDTWMFVVAFVVARRATHRYTRRVISDKLQWYVFCWNALLPLTPKPRFVWSHQWVPPPRPLCGCCWVRFVQFCCIKCMYSLDDVSVDVFVHIRHLTAYCRIITARSYALARYELSVGRYLDVCNDNGWQWTLQQKCRPATYRKH